MKLSSILLLISLFLAMSICTDKHISHKVSSYSRSSNGTGDGKPIARLINIIGKADLNKSRLVLESHQDPQFINKDQKIDYEKQCQLKQGYLANIVEYGQSGQKDSNLHGQPVFSVLNSHNLAVFENENVNSLIYTIELSEISQVYVPRSWSSNNLFCFQIVAGPLNKRFFLNQTGDAPLKDARATLCASNLNELANWLKAIKSLLIDCNEMGREVAKNDSQMKVKRKNVDDELSEFENLIGEEGQKQKVKDLELKQKEKEKQNLIKTQFTDIMAEVEKQKLEEQKQVSMLEEERKKIEEKTQTLEEQKECLKDTLDVKRQEEIKISEILIKEEEEKSEENLIKNAKDKILYAQQKEYDEIRQQEEDLKKEALKRQEGLKKNIIQEMALAEKELDPSLCYAAELKSDPIVAMKKGCTKLINPGTVPDVKKIEKCMYRSNYCNTCCNYFIGVNHGVQREVCKQKCRGLLFPETFEEQQYDYVIKVPTSNKITDLMKKQAHQNSTSSAKTSPPLNQDSTSIPAAKGSDKDASSDTKSTEFRFRSVSSTVSKKTSLRGSKQATSKQNKQK